MRIEEPPLMAPGTPVPTVGAVVNREAEAARRCRTHCRRGGCVYRSTPFVETLKGLVRTSRDNGKRGYEAGCIAGTAEYTDLAVEDGSILEACLSSRPSGITVSRISSIRSKRFCYYYAHLEQYAEGSRTVRRFVPAI